MATKSAARPVKQPARAIGASRAVKASPKKSVPRKSASQKSKEESARAVKPDADEKRAAAVVARKATMAKTMRRVGDTALVVDAHDDVAEQKIARHKRTAVDKASVRRRRPALRLSNA
jgi:hypothetical protein